ncbi:DUF5134 domain-containing protein [Streptomyces sp. NBC_00448]|uniref:DUF5134 domain-containing protein n=1 Tax=Streptomyces sp. NBC_00448 TaxID=2903652 RepID=UPI002E1DE8C9
MIAAHGLRWILTVLFAAVTLLSVARALRPGQARAAAERTTHALHALMGTAMAVMVWPRGMDVPATPQAVFFLLAAAWFVVAALLRGRWIWRGPGEAGHPRTHVVLHAVMMGGMAWMLLAMPDDMSSGPSPAGGSGAMADMPGMDMSGPGGGMSMQLHGTSHSVAVVLLVVFVVMGLWWLSRAFDTARLAPAVPEPPAVGPAVPGTHREESALLRGAVDAGCHGAMAFGMAVMLLAMV